MRDLLDRAGERRTDLVRRLAAEGTDCYRLFHGVAEGRPGLTVDRYGPLVLCQTFRDPLEQAELACLESRYPSAVFVDRSRGLHRGEADVLARELGLVYRIVSSPARRDAGLFLDLRSTRRWILGHARGLSVLNLFAYTCGVGMVAAAGGAAEVWNVDASRNSLTLGAENFERNGLQGEFLAEDALPILWQLAGLPVKGRGARRRRYLKVPRRQFDLVVLDPPPRARGPFGAVDLVRDYQSLFKPALLATAPGGRVLAVNNVGSVTRERFETLLVRCAEKAGRPLAGLDWLTPDEDFPTLDDSPPLKVAICAA